MVEEERLKRERENRKKQEQSRWVDCDAKGSLSKTIHLKSASECNFKTLFLYLFLCHGVIGYKVICVGAKQGCQSSCFVPFVFE